MSYSRQASLRFRCSSRCHPSDRCSVPAGVLLLTLMSRDVECIANRRRVTAAHYNLLRMSPKLAITNPEGISGKVLTRAMRITSRRSLAQNRAGTRNYQLSRARQKRRFNRELSAFPDGPPFFEQGALRYAAILGFDFDTRKFFLSLRALSDGPIVCEPLACCLRSWRNRSIIQL